MLEVKNIVEKILEIFKGLMILVLIMMFLVYIGIAIFGFITLCTGAL